MGPNLCSSSPVRVRKKRLMRCSNKLHKLHNVRQQRCQSPFITSVTVTDSFMVYGALGGSTLHARYINNLMGSLGRWGGGERKPLCRIIKK